MRVKVIDGFEAYRIWEDGTLESNWRMGAHYPGMLCPDKWTRLPARYNESGYIPVCLRGVAIKQRRTHIHRLVAESFIGPAPFGGACVRHLDGNPKNNHVDNLAWGTYLDNENDKRRHGTHNSRITNARLTERDIDEIRSIVVRGESHAQIARRYGVSRPTIGRLLAGVTWK